MTLVPTAHALDPLKQFHDYGIDNWNTTNAGLPQTSVLTITQDRTGYIWVGTQDGLARFDGLRFDVFDRRNSDGTDPLNVNASLCDSHGRLWFGKPNGVLFYENGHFHKVESSVAAKPVNAIVESNNGEIWIGTTDGAMRYQGNSLVATGHTTPVYSLVREANSIWMGGPGMVTLHASDGERVFQVPGGKDTLVTRLALSAQGLWIGTPTGLYLLPHGGNEIVAQPLDVAANTKSGASSRIENLFVDRDDNLWIGTPTILFRRRPGGIIERVREEDFVRSAYVDSAFEDREGDLWLGSRTEGLFRLWNGWANRLDANDGLSDSLIWSVTRDPAGHIVLGSNSNVMRLDEDGPREILSTKQIPNLSAYEINYDANGRLWIGMRAGLAVYDHDQVTTPQVFSRLARAQVNAVVPQNDVYWIGSQEGLFRYDGKELRQIPAAPGVAEAQVRGIHIGVDGTLTVSTEAGVRQMDGDVLRPPAWAKPLEGRFVTSVTTISPGLLGITTRDAGIGLMRDNHLLMLDDRNGLPVNNSWAMQTLGDYLYVPNIDGVWRIPIAALPDPVTATNAMLAPERVLGRLTGMQHIHCCNGGGRSRILVDGTSLWFPAIHGAVRVDTKAIVPPPLPPTIVVEQLHHGDRWYNADDAISIDSPQRDIELRFTALSFREPQGILFRYLLEGYDTEWHEAGTRRSAFYTNLPPGNFRFRVEARTGSALSEFTTGGNPKLAQLSFKFVPRWFERRSVQIAAILLLFAMAAMAPLIIRNRYHRRGLQLEAQVRERTGELRDANEQQIRANLALQESNIRLAGQIEDRLAAERALQASNADLLALNHKLEHTQKQLIQSEKLASIGQLAAGVAHEINNPIGYVHSNLSTLQQYGTQLLSAIETFTRTFARGDNAARLAEVEEIRQRFEIDALAADLPQLLIESREGIERVSKIVRDLRDFSRIDRDEAWVDADVHRGLESTLNIVANELKFKARIVKNFGDLPPIKCLPSELNQVFMNILMNAGQAIKERGVITVSTGRTDDKIWISISDDGEGIPAAVLPRIFDPFYTTKPVGSGTGLGLSISYGIVAKHSGTIEAESVLGQGTSVRVELPIEQPT
jgi:signal transduction histidine kinase/ligand-binding sensor domain-containing protein